MKAKILNCLILLFLSLAAVSCGSDDKEDDQPDSPEVSIVGVWQIADSQDNITLTFNSNGHFSYDDYDYEEESGYGTYSVSGNMLTTIWTNWDDDITKYKILTLTSTKLVLQVAGEPDDVSEWYRMR